VTDCHSLEIQYNRYQLWVNDLNDAKSTFGQGAGQSLRIVLGWNFQETIIWEEQGKEDMTVVLAAMAWIVLLLLEGTCFGTSKNSIRFVCYKKVPLLSW
jgi:hypothetical protein